MPLHGVKKRRYQQLWHYRRRTQWLYENGPCARCGSIKSLEVHHVRPEDKIEHWVWSWRKERRDAELAKCEVLCRKCHLIQTGKDFGWWKHGARGYQNGCRCEECRAGHNARAKDYTRRKRESREAQMIKTAVR